MKYIFKLLIIFSASLILFSCNSPKPKEELNVKSDSTELHESDEVPKSEQSVEPNESQTIEIEVGSTKTYVLKWKVISPSEYGISYGFEDSQGQEIYFFRIDIPDFSVQENDYFTYTEIEGSVFPKLEIKESIKNNWYEVQVEGRLESPDGEENEEDKGVVPVIISIKPI